MKKWQQWMMAGGAIAIGLYAAIEDMAPPPARPKPTFPIEEARRRTIDAYSSAVTNRNWYADDVQTAIDEIVVVIRAEDATLARVKDDIASLPGMCNDDAARAIAPYKLSVLVQKMDGTSPIKLPCPTP